MNMNASPQTEAWVLCMNEGQLCYEDPTFFYFFLTTE